MGLDNPIHIAFLLVILLLVFGAKRLPEMGRSLGSGLRGFKESINGDHVADELPAATTMAAVRDEERERDHAAAATTV
jgi:sec-independent protein translocase protein TatA